MELKRPEDATPDEGTKQADVPSQPFEPNGTVPRAPIEADPDAPPPQDHQERSDPDRGQPVEESKTDADQDRADGDQEPTSQRDEPTSPPRFAFKDKRIFASDLDDLDDEPPSSDKPTYVEQLERRVQEAEQRLAEYIKAYKEKTEVEWAELKSRLERDMERQVLQARKQMVLDLLEVLDNFGRTIESAKTTSDIATLITGIEMVERQFLSKLQALGLEPIDATAAPFDPNLHEAAGVEDVEDESLDGKVVEVYRQGYSFAGALLRPALVRVGKKRS